MSTKTGERQQEAKMALLDAGMQLMFEKGYTNSGIQEILDLAQVPKGSFYHYFDNKESFAVEIIRHFDRLSYPLIDRTINNRELSPLNRLRSFFEEKTVMLAEGGCRKGCLIGNLSQEMADQSEVLRTELSTVMRKQCDVFAACIADGQRAQEITSTYPAETLAEFFLCSWSGAVMLAKTVKNTKPLQIFADVMLQHILPA